MINSRAERYCQTCGTHLKGKYCHNCGEKYLEPEDKSVKKWIGHLFSDIWMLDGKLLRTLKGLLLFPGRLAQDYTKGKRVPYLKPLNLFLLINLVYFLSPTLDTFTTQLYTQMHGLPHSPMVERTVEGYLADEGITFEELAPVYDKKTNEVSKLIIIVLAPLLGLVVYGLFFKQGIYLSDGFNLALQFWAFFLLIFMIILPNLSRLLDKLFDAAFFTSDTVVSIAALVITATYSAFQFLHWRGKRWWVYSLKVLVLTVAFLPLVMIYRFILFWVTYLVL